MLTDIAFDTLKKYGKGEDIENENEIPFLEYYASVGVVKRMGFSLERETNTAILTARGRRLIQNEKIRRNLFRKFLRKYWVYLTR